MMRTDRDSLRSLKTKVHHPETGQLLVSDNSQSTNSHQYCLNVLHTAALVGQITPSDTAQITSDMVNAFSPNGKTPLMILACGNRDEVSRQFNSSAGGFMDGDQEKMNAYLKKLEQFKHKMMMQLFSLGCDPNLRNPFTGDTAMHYAVKSDRFDLLKLLLNRGSGMNIRNFEGLDILGSAIEWNAEKCIELILSMFITDIDLKDNVTGETVLIKAVANMSNKIVELILMRGANKNLTDREGKTALHWAALVGNTQAAQILLEKGMSPNLFDKKLRTPLIYACSEGRTEIVTLLVNSYGADIFVPDVDNRTTWDVALINGHQEIYEMLKGCAEINQPQNELLNLNQQKLTIQAESTDRDVFEGQDMMNQLFINSGNNDNPGEQQVEYNNLFHTIMSDRQQQN